MKWFLDFEASSLNLIHSYPIEVGWCDENGENGQSYLIIPHENWTDWDAGSQSIHKIKRRDLFDYGIPGNQVAQIMNEALEGKDIHVDGGQYDEFWCNRLFVAANLDRKFKFQGYYELVEKECSHQTYICFIKEWTQSFTMHRALADAKKQADFYKRYKNNSNV